jgi:Family of unknown function (DUF6326)
MTTTVMPEIPIRLAVLWVALMLTYLLGDVLRIFAGDFKPGEIGGVKAEPGMWLAAAALMLLPIAMVVVSVMFDGQVARWVHIVAAIGLLGFNLIGLPTYPGLYDRFLIGVGLVFNALTVWTAWGWEIS